jgi:hypothetical protein
MKLNLCLWAVGFNTRGDVPKPRNLHAFTVAHKAKAACKHLNIRVSATQVAEQLNVQPSMNHY